MKKCFIVLALAVMAAVMYHITLHTEKLSTIDTNGLTQLDNEVVSPALNSGVTSDSQKKKSDSRIRLRCSTPGLEKHPPSPAVAGSGVTGNTQKKELKQDKEVR